MGGCVGTGRRRRDNSSSRRPSMGGYSESTSSNQDRGSGSSGTKNRTLRHEKIRWKSDIPLTEGQLKSKRDEFWDTAPAFEGKQEIWNALKAAVEATELENGGDYDLAQAILDGAGISMPNGSLVESYDELGNRYAIPVYCLSLPINLVVTGDKNGVENNDVAINPSVEMVLDKKSLGNEMRLKIRTSLTDSQDTRLIVYSGESVYSAKKRLYNQVKNMVEPPKQRWFFGGKMLSDKTKIGDCNIPNGHVVQCIVNYDEAEDPGTNPDVIQTAKD